MYGPTLAVGPDLVLEFQLLVLIWFHSIHKEFLIVINFFDTHQHYVYQKFPESINYFIYISFVYPFFVVRHHSILLKT